MKYDIIMTSSKKRIKKINNSSLFILSQRKKRLNFIKLSVCYLL